MAKVLELKFTIAVHDEPKDVLENEQPTVNASESRGRSKTPRMADVVEWARKYIESGELE